MAKTSIEWTSGPNGEEGYTFNPFLGCSKVHAGCTNCYAEVSQAVSMRKGGAVQWGEVWQGGQRVVVADSTWKHPLTWARAAAKAGERRKVFCASLADVLEVPAMPPLNAKPGAFAEVERVRGMLDGARERLWDTIRKTARVRVRANPHAGETIEGGLDWLILTKRPENWHLVPEDVRPLVWLGTSISNQETADEYVPRLLGAEGFRYRFLSVEPLVGPVTLWASWLKAPEDEHSRQQHVGHAASWVICGGESGPKARPCNVEWIRSIVSQCAEAGVPCFVKQLGGGAVRGETAADHRYPHNFGAFYGDNLRLVIRDPKGGDWDEWPEDLKVRQWPV